MIFNVKSNLSWVVFKIMYDGVKHGVSEFRFAVSWFSNLQLTTCTCRSFQKQYVPFKVFECMPLHVWQMLLTHEFTY